MSFKVHSVPLFANFAAIVINSILLVSYVNFMLRSNFASILEMNITVTFVFFTFLVIFSAFRTFDIPYLDYAGLSDEEAEETFVIEIVGITTHIMVSSILTGLFVVGMYLVTL